MYRVDRDRSAETLPCRLGGSLVNIWVFLCVYICEIPKENDMVGLVSFIVESTHVWDLRCRET